MSVGRAWPFSPVATCYLPGMLRGLLRLSPANPWGQPGESSLKSWFGGLYKYYQSSQRWLGVRAIVNKLLLFFFFFWYLFITQGLAGERLGVGVVAWGRIPLGIHSFHKYFLPTMYLIVSILGSLAVMPSNTVRNSTQNHCRTIHIYNSIITQK